MTKDSRGFRASGYAHMLNAQYGTVAIPWIYEQGVFTNIEPALYTGNTFNVPDDSMDWLPLGQLSSTIGTSLDVTPLLQFAVDIVNTNTSWMPQKTSLLSDQL